MSSVSRRAKGRSKRTLAALSPFLRILAVRLFPSSLCSCAMDYGSDEDLNYNEAVYNQERLGSMSDFSDGSFSAMDGLPSSNAPSPMPQNLGDSGGGSGKKRRHQVTRACMACATAHVKVELTSSCSHEFPSCAFPLVRRPAPLPPLSEPRHYLRRKATHQDEAIQDSAVAYALFLSCQSSLRAREFSFPTSPPPPCARLQCF